MMRLVVPTILPKLFFAQVTDLNIFSSSLSVEEMVEKTKGGEGCPVEGDYLQWSQAQWTLFGQARYFFTNFTENILCQASLEVVGKGEVCSGNPPFTLYAATFPQMEACCCCIILVITIVIAIDTASHQNNMSVQEVLFFFIVQK